MRSEGIDFQDFFENGPFPLHVVGRDGEILAANAAELALLGYTEQEYVGRSISDFHADRWAIEDILARLSRGEKLVRVPARLLHKDGSIRHVEISSSGRFQDGEFVNTRCLTVDVTQMRFAEQQRAESERHWRMALDAVPAAIYTTDAEGRITYFNKAAVELSGRTPQLGTDSWCVTWRLFNLDGTPLSHEECPMALALKEGREIRGAEAIAERPDGTRIRFQPYPTPLHDQHGQLTGAVNLLIDVTQQRADEADAARLAAIVVSSTDAIVSKTLDGIVTSWNDGAAQIFGYTAAEMIGQSLMRIIPPDLYQEEAHILSKLRAGEHLNHFETTRVTKDGRRIDVSLSVSPVKDKSGRLIGAAKVARDISERKRAEQVQRLLLSELNHRIKNTLTTVQSIASQTLRRTPNPTEFVPTFLERLQAIANAHGLLTESNWQGAELRALVRSQVPEIDADERIECAGPEIVLPPQLALHTGLVLHELATNARKHGALSASHGRVTIEWRVQPGAHPILRLHWEEVGGPPIYADQARRQGFGTILIERTTKALEGGDARMQLGSSGITWDLTLPLPRSMPSAGGEPGMYREDPRLTLKTGRRRSQRILLVEDEPLVALDVQTMLADAGFEVVGPVSSLNEALRYAATKEFDAALLDANLGGRPVDELAAALTRQNVPFAFITGYGRASLPAAFASAPLIPKPFNTALLVSTTKNLLSKDGVLSIRAADSR